MNQHHPRLAPFARAALAAAALTLAAGGLAGAQTAAPATMPVAAPPPAAAPPSYATPSGEDQIAGTISAVTGKYTLQLRDRAGYLDNVTLHQGTIINPTGLKLAPGMAVTVVGHNIGPSFAANEINAPYGIALVAPAGPLVGVGVGWGWGPRYRFGFGW